MPYSSLADDRMNDIMEIIISPSATNGYGRAESRWFFCISVQIPTTYQCDFPGADPSRHSPACPPPYTALRGRILIVPHTQRISLWFCPSGPFWFAWREPEQTPPVTAGRSMSAQTKHARCRSHLCFHWSNSSDDVGQAWSGISNQYGDHSLCLDTIKGVDAVEATVFIDASPSSPPHIYFTHWIWRSRQAKRAQGFCACLVLMQFHSFLYSQFIKKKKKKTE